MGRNRVFEAVGDVNKDPGPVRDDRPTLIARLRGDDNLVLSLLCRSVLWDAEELTESDRPRVVEDDDDGLFIPAVNCPTVGKGRERGLLDDRFLGTEIDDDDAVAEVVVMVLLTVGGLLGFNFAMAA